MRLGTATTLVWSSLSTSDLLVIPDGSKAFHMSKEIRQRRMSGPSFELLSTSDLVVISHKLKAFHMSKESVVEYRSDACLALIGVIANF